MTRRRIAALAGLFLFAGGAACFPPPDEGPEGYRCASDLDCPAPLRCLELACRNPATWDGGQDAGAIDPTPLTFTPVRPQLELRVAAIDQVPGAEGSQVLVVAENGTAAYFDDGVWRNLSVDGGEDFRAVSLVSSTSGFVGGDRGSLYRFDGVALRPLVRDGGTSPIVAIHALPSGVALAASRDGTVWHFDGGTWAKTSSPLVEANDVWISPGGFDHVAGRSAAGKPTIHSRGPFGPFVDVLDAGGSFTAIGPSFDGGSRATVGLSTGELYLFNSRAPDDFTRVTSFTPPASSRVARVTAEQNAEGGADQLGVYVEGSATGALYLSSSPSATLAPLFSTRPVAHVSRVYSSGSVLAQVSPTNMGSTVVHVRPSGAPQALALGEDFVDVAHTSTGGLLMLNASGDVLRLSASGVEMALSGTFSSGWRAIAAGTHANVLLLGASDRSARYDGAITPITGAPNIDWFDACASGDEGFAVGSGGRAARWNATQASLTETPTPASVALTAVHCLGPASAIAVGSQGTVLRYDGTWTQFPVAFPVPTASLRSVDAAPDGNVYVAGDDTFARFHEGTWTLLPARPGLRNLVVLSPQLIYATSSTELVRFDGSAWETVQTASRIIQAGLKRGPREVVFVGGRGFAVQGR